MRNYDVIIVGGGISGCFAAALLAKNGKKVLLLEKGNKLGGRALTWDYEGFQLSLGAHLLEDPGSGLGAILNYLGKPIEEGPLNDALPIWQDNKWQHITDLYKTDRTELQRIITEIVSSDFSDFDRYDNVPLRTWLQERTKSEGVIALFEILAVLEVITDKWYDHSAGDNLYCRKMHYQERHMAGFSHIPKGGFQAIFDNVQAAMEENHVRFELNTCVRRIAIDGPTIKGVEIEIGPRLTPNDLPDLELIEAPVVLCTLPVWYLFDVIDPSALPNWYVNQIKLMARDENKTCWTGFYAGTEEPVYALSEKELTGWFNAPRTGLAGFGFNISSLDPSAAPDGKSLFVCGCISSAENLRNRAWLSKTVRDFEKDMEEMFPKLKQALWKRWHLILDPPYTILGKPGLSGGNRPDNKAPNIEGLYFAGDTYKSRGIGMDRAARAALTCAELILGKRLEGLENTWRY
ncbi:phytoene desaturase family protein [Thermodesulfobacteriota bacterium]